MRYILALDQGTTSSRAILFDEGQNIVSISQRDFRQIYPKPGYVEHDPAEIFSSQYSVMLEAVAKSGINPAEISAIGITNQRETTIVWDKSTGAPVHNAIVWQCRRTSDECRRLKENGYTETILNKTGLVPDAYFSATKLAWVLDNVDGARERAKRGDLLFGTVDSYLVWRLTKGRSHVTDYTNASRTMLFNIHTKQWDDELCKLFDIPKAMLPEVYPSGHIFGHTNIDGFEIPIAAIAGDQQAALFGQGCFYPGQSKNTYGTGCFLLMNAGNTPPAARGGLLTTIAATTEGETPQYALEGSVFVGGAVIQWLRDEMKLISDAREAEGLASSVSTNGGVYLVPAFTGLGAPHWDMYARGSIFGITRGTKPAHIVRAAEEAIAYQSAELLEAIRENSGFEINELNVDGGACRDGFLMQFQADILGIPVRRPIMRESTALGVCNLAGLVTGVWENKESVSELHIPDKLFVPQMDRSESARLLKGWKKAVECCKMFKES